MRRRTLLGLACFAQACLIGAGLAAVLPAAAHAGEEKAAPVPDTYMPINTLTAYTIKANGRRGVMTVDCGLDIPDAKLRQRADLLLPRLRAAYVQTVQIYAGGLPSDLPPNPDFLARNLQRDTDDVLGRKGARVLMGAILLN